MGRYWSVRRAGSSGPAAAQGVVTVTELLANLVLGQTELGGFYRASWLQAAPDGVTVVFVVVEHLDHSNIINGTSALVEAETVTFEAGIEAGLLVDVIATADGYADVTGGPYLTT